MAERKTSIVKAKVPALAKRSLGTATKTQA